MGLTDFFRDAAHKFTDAAKSAVDSVERLAQEAKREWERATHEAEQVVKRLTGGVSRTAEEIEIELRGIMPNFENKLAELNESIINTASSAAENGVDITESIEGAAFLHDAHDTLFRMLEGYLPSFLDRLLQPVRDLIDWILKKLDSLAETLKEGVTAVVNKIKTTTQGWIRKIGEELGPIWDFIKKLWRLLFGAEPEQCSVTAQWFDEKMKRAERQMLSKGKLALIRKRTYFEALPPATGAWTTVVSDFLNPHPVWSVYRARLMAQLTTPGDGQLGQVSLDQLYTDRLGGRQRIQISVLHYRWRTEEFRKVSAGFLGILAMVSAVGQQGENEGKVESEERNELSSAITTMIARRQRQLPLKVDPATAVEICRIVEPHLQLRNIEEEQAQVYEEDKGARRTLQVLARDEHGWKDIRT
ncbi:MAG: hypothetical protein M1825_003021 [Sarcosagium campestre]|nr:MAG: hypothetical protein M1825_003021 [Sarcosagium campestre]